MSISKNDLRFIRSLQQKKVRNEQSMFVIEGKKLVEEALQAKFASQFLVSTDKDFCERNACNLISESEMQACSSMKNAPGYLMVLEKQSLPKLNLQNAKRVVVLDGITDPGNLGTILRTSEWFGLDGVLINEKCVEIENPKVIQASMGSVLRVPTIVVNSHEAIEQLNEMGLEILVADMIGSSIYSHVPSDSWALVMGSESHGVSPEFQHLNRINIPSKGKAESLNVAIASAILISHLTEE
jgi:TrmH family RNA methyltransferase